MVESSRMKGRVFEIWIYVYQILFLNRHSSKEDSLHIVNNKQ